MAPSGHLTRATGVGLVVANMVGAGVFLSAGFMAQDLGPAAILASWGIGIVGTLLGVHAYGALAHEIGRSGGEYRYLSDTVHPSLGFLSGWASLLVGFSAAIAVDALAIGVLAQQLWLGAPDPRLLGTGVLVALTALHAARYSVSDAGQNALVAVKLMLVGGFLAVGLGVGEHAWPTWTPPNPGKSGELRTWLANQYWITFAFSGWNAAIYAAGEFRDPKRDVPWAMGVGSGLVAVLYLLINWVFVANLTPTAAQAVFAHDDTQVHLGHVVMTELVGPVGGQLTSAAMILVFLSAMSAMTLVGPRVYASMAEDGVLPRALAAREGHPPLGSVVLQSAVAGVLLWSHTLLESMQSVGGILMIFGGLTAMSVVRLPTAPLTARVAGAVYAAWMLLLLAVGVTASTKLLLTLGAVLGVGAVAYALAARS
ncbi:MAG: amino acid permease [Deltaproteobacteria bacterium]|nr:MAG: amino acid permease [Deltaproteobacteria bacterium]